MGVENQLIPIPRTEWFKLRDLYKINWPKHYVHYCTVDTYISWIEQDPNVKSIEIYSLNGDFSDGTYVAIDRFQVIFCTLNESFDNLVNALNCLDKKKSYFFYGFVERILPAVKKVFENWSIPFESMKPDTTDFLYISKENALQFKYTVPEGFVLRPVTEEYAEVANDVWPHKHPGSVSFFLRTMKYNPSLGLFDEKTNEMIAWCFLSVYQSFFALQVNENHKRKGYGTLMVKAFAKQRAEAGYNIGAPVITQNEASRSMFLKCGFKIIDNLYWVSFPSQVNPDYVWTEE